MTAARELWSLIEPIAANVYFAPEVHAAFEDLGFDGSRGATEGVQYPDRVAYFTSRGACLGQVPGEIVAARCAGGPRGARLHQNDRRLPRPDAGCMLLSTVGMERRTRARCVKATTPLLQELLQKTLEAADRSGF